MARLVDQIGPVLIIRTDHPTTGTTYEAGCERCPWTATPARLLNTAIEDAYQHVETEHGATY